MKNEESKAISNRLQYEAVARWRAGGRDTAAGADDDRGERTMSGESVNELRSTQLRRLAASLLLHEPWDLETWELTMDTIELSEKCRRMEERQKEMKKQADLQTIMDNPLRPVPVVVRPPSVKRPGFDDRDICQCGHERYRHVTTGGCFMDQCECREFHCALRQSTDHEPPVVIADPGDRRTLIDRSCDCCLTCSHPHFHHDQPDGRCHSHECSCRSYSAPV